MQYKNQQYIITCFIILKIQVHFVIELKKYIYIYMRANENCIKEEIAHAHSRHFCC